jgi:hypothetical protein
MRYKQKNLGMASGASAGDGIFIYLFFLLLLAEYY